MDKKYYCPECGRECFWSVFYKPGAMVCRDMGHWAGQEKDCLTEKQVKAKFEKYQPVATSSKYAWW